ncbi:uncharacterized protein LOC132201718 isoform X1 [Neocloeon triangulifer]|uniref:uncharacterized protein LOC132201718 isoform X1 n=1 Tax=Neocloeon triangulifer TaxID=2078957 RepID=UPI00286EE7B2|nr:uncharacterized protein LOC132201718 isoform X1 [Neocloeon triangulifer]
MSKWLSCCFVLLLLCLALADPKAEYLGPSEDIYDAYRTFSELNSEIAKFQAKATSILFGDILIEATSVYERVFQNLAALGASEPLVDVSRALASEGTKLIHVLLSIIDEGCLSFEERLLDANDDLRDGRFEEVPGDYVDFYERNAIIEAAYVGMLPMINTTLVFLEESSLAAIADLEGPLVIEIHGELQRGRILIEDSLSSFSVAKIFYNSAVNASMDALYQVVRQIHLTHASTGRKYTINKLH